MFSLRLKRSVDPRAVEEKAGLLRNDDLFLKRLRHVYAPDALEELGEILSGIRKSGGVQSEKERQIAQVKQPFLDRMFDLSSFIGEIKQRMTQWYNGRNDRKGTLWEERFRSVLVQGESGILATVAAYIDLNSVRAGIAKDPRDWRWCGYAEATAAQSVAREGIYETLGESEKTSRDGTGWRRVHQRYRRILMHQAMERRGDSGEVLRKGISRQQFQADEARDFNLPPAVVLHQRIRYFTDGLALGTDAFVESVFHRQKRLMGVLREVGPRVPRMQELGALRTLRDLRRERRVV